MRRAVLSFVVCVAMSGLAGVAPADESKATVGLDESIAKLCEIFRAADAPGGPAAGQPGVDFTAGENGTLQVRRLVQIERAEFHFRSVAEEKWRVSPSDLDAQGVAVKLDPIGVYVPVKKSMKRIVVERCEEKTRTESLDEPGHQWQEKHRFTTSYVFIPASDPKQADDAAAAIKQMIKSAPKRK